MIYNYYKQNNKFYKIKEYFEQASASENINISIKNKIKKLNDYNFFNLFNEVINYKSISDLTKKDLEYFFIENERTYYLNDELPFLDSKENNIKNERFITFNSKSELQNIVMYLINTQEYPKQTLITKLLHLKDCIFEKNLSPIYFIKQSFIYYCDSKANDEEFEKINFSLNIIGKLNDFEIELVDLVHEIDSKIKSLNSSIPIQGNYLIDINNDFLRDLYLSLEKHMFIDQNKTSQEQFIHVLKSNWEDHNSIIYLEMDNIQFNYLLILLEENFKIKIQLSSVEYTGNIRTKNNTFKAYSVSSSYSQAKRKGTEPKRMKDILAIIEKLKSKNKKD